MRSLTSKRLTIPALFVVAASLTNCSSDPIGGSDTSNSTCDNIASASTDTHVDATVRSLLVASTDFESTATNAKTSLLKACANIATDLGAKDSWSSFGDSDDSISNGGNTGACNVAALRIKTIMEASANANFALVVTKGACYPDFAEQAKCDAQCNAHATCDSGTVETRCEPAEFSCKCDTVCSANSFCKGTATLEANCMGECESTCTGECKGTCVGEDGTKTEDDPNCKGKCRGQCNGTCKGECKIEALAGMNCGANVRCRGKCEGTHSEPKCETTFTPPSCVVDPNCIDACSASVAAHAICDPPTVDLLCDASVNADIPKLVATVRANLPSIIAASETQGKLVLAAALRLKAAGEAVVNASSNLNARSISCAASGAKITVSASATLNSTVQGGADVADTCASHSI